MKLTTKDMILCAIFASITAILAQIAIPLPGGVPFTLQVFAITLAGVVLGGKKGFISQVVYVLLGAIGLPVFAHLSGGIANIVGPTGGYIIAFPLIALFGGYASEKSNNILVILLAVIAALAIDYAIGTLQFSIIANMPISKAISLCVIPFVPFDLAKLVLATIIGVSIKSKVSSKIVSA